MSCLKAFISGKEEDKTDKNMALGQGGSTEYSKDVIPDIDQDMEAAEITGNVQPRDHVSICICGTEAADEDGEAEEVLPYEPRSCLNKWLAAMWITFELMMGISLFEEAYKATHECSYYVWKTELAYMYMLAVTLVLLGVLNAARLPFRRDMNRCPYRFFTGLIELLASLTFMLIFLMLIVRYRMKQYPEKKEGEETEAPCATRLYEFLGVMTSTTLLMHVLFVISEDVWTYLLKREAQATMAE